MKKLFIFSFIALISFSWFSYAINEFNYNNALEIANKYISDSNSLDDNWKWKNPRIEKEWKYFYTDSDSPSYVEFKVSCDNNSDCWFIMVNFDWDDVSIPMASTSWNTPSEILIAQNWSSPSDNKLYYLNPFEQYSEDLKSWEVSSIDPQDNIDNALKTDSKLSELDKKEKRKKFKEELKTRLNKAKKDAKDFKKTDEFKMKKKELKDNKMTIPKEEVSFKILPFANAAQPNLNQWWYTPITASDTFVPWNSVWTCWSRIPCYNQYRKNYTPEANWINCAVWCAPIAVSMIYWYHDNHGYNNLVPWTATFINNSDTITLADRMKTLMWTLCNSDKEWSTTSSNIKLAIQYAKDKWYANSISNYYPWNWSTLFPTIKSEINAGRPVVLNTDNHSIVAYWYNKSITTANIVRVNVWWWEANSMTGSDNKKYYTSNIDYNMNYIYYNNANHSTNSIVTFKIAQ